MEQRAANQKAALHTPCWTELSARDPEAARAFYAAVFGWLSETDPRPEAGGYSMFKLDQAPVAAVAPLFDEAQPVAWSVCLAVEDADKTAAKAGEYGGSTLMAATEVFDLGRYGVLADPTGASFSIWEARKFSGAEILGDPNSLGWIELASRDPKAALEFYPAVFGWATHLSDAYTEWSVGGTHFGGLADLNQMPGESERQSYWKPYFRVADVDGIAAMAKAEGAEVQLPPMTVPGNDVRISVIKDPQGAVFGIFDSAARR